MPSVVGLSSQGIVIPSEVEGSGFFGSRLPDAPRQSLLSKGYGFSRTVNNPSEASTSLPKAGEMLHATKAYGALTHSDSWGYSCVTPRLALILPSQEFGLWLFYPLVV
jgi:hypothetical protein